MAGNQPLIVDAFVGEEKPRRHHSVLYAFTVNEGIKPTDYDGTQLATHALFEDLDLTHQSVVCQKILEIIASAIVSIAHVVGQGWYQDGIGGVKR